MRKVLATCMYITSITHQQLMHTSGTILFHVVSKIVPEVDPRCQRIHGFVLSQLRLSDKKYLIRPRYKLDLNISYTDAEPP